MSHLTSPENTAKAFLRNTIAGSPKFGDQFTCLGIDELPGRDTMLFHLDNGWTIEADIRCVKR